MKKFIALLLAALILCCASAVAFAETGYVRIKSVLSGSISDTFSVDSFSLELDELPEDKKVVVVADCDDGTVVLFGKNSSGSPEGTLWQFDDETGPMIVFGVLCGQWDTMAAYLSDGYGMSILLLSEESDLSYLVQSSSEAAAAYAIISEAFQ